MPDAISYSLSVILTAMYADNYNFGRKFLFELPQLRKYVNTVDSPICPEIEEDDFPSQIGQAKRPVSGMYPVEITGEIRCPYGGHCWRIGHLNGNVSVFVRGSCYNNMAGVDAHLSLSELKSWLQPEKHHVAVKEAEKRDPPAALKEAERRAAERARDARERPHRERAHRERAQLARVQEKSEHRRVSVRLSDVPPAHYRARQRQQSG